MGGGGELCARVRVVCEVNGRGGRWERVRGVEVCGHHAAPVGLARIGRRVFDDI